MSTDIFNQLKERGFYQQATAVETLIESLNSQTIKAYTGFDPTGPSLHCGHLIPIMGLAQLKRAGHSIIALMGGGTAMIGDPSGKIEMRKMLTVESIDSNINSIKKQLSNFLEFNEGTSILINNADWLRDLNYLNFLREIGSQFSVNRMLSFETYKERMKTGLSFLEFNYQLLQAYDFLELSKRFACNLQLGGDDQWANIISGVDLIRRKTQGQSFGWTYPLLTTASGKKMGKTEKGAVWLDPNLTSPYEYFQYWRNTEDSDVIKFLKLFTFLDIEEINALEQLEISDIYKVKEKLAFEATKIAHGITEAENAIKGARNLFSAGGDTKNIPSTSVTNDFLNTDVFSAYTYAGLTKSNSEARRLLKQGGIYLNDNRIDDPNYVITNKDFITDVSGGSTFVGFNEYVNIREEHPSIENFEINDFRKKEKRLLLRAGKKRFHRLVLEDGNN